MRDLDRSNPLPPGLLLFGGKPSAIELTFAEMRVEITALTDEVRRRAACNT